MKTHRKRERTVEWTVPEGEHVNTYETNIINYSDIFSVNVSISSKYQNFHSVSLAQDNISDSLSRYLDCARKKSAPPDFQMWRNEKIMHYVWKWQYLFAYSLRLKRLRIHEPCMWWPTALIKLGTCSTPHVPMLNCIPTVHRNKWPHWICPHLSEPLSSRTDL